MKTPVWRYFSLSKPLLCNAISHRFWNVMTPIYLRIEYYRERKGWSQAQLARESGVNQSIISRIESGETQSIHFQNLHRIAKALEVPAAALLVEED